MRRLADRLSPLGPVLVVLEATGGYELAAVAALAAAALPVVVVNPRQGRDFAQATPRGTGMGQVFGRRTRVVKQSLKAHVAYLELELRLTDTALGRAMRELPVRREKAELYRSVPGVGRVVALALLAELP